MADNADALSGPGGIGMADNADALGVGMDGGVAAGGTAAGGRPSALPKKEAWAWAP